MATTEYLGEDVPKIAGFLNELLGMDRNFGGYRSIYPEGTQDYQIASGEVQPIDYVRQEYGADPGQMGPDLEESAPGLNTALQARIDAGEFEDDLWEGTAGELGMGASDYTNVNTPSANGDNQVTIENQNRLNENASQRAKDLAAQTFKQNYGSDVITAKNYPALTDVTDFPDAGNNQSSFVGKKTATNPSGAMSRIDRSRAGAQYRRLMDEIKSMPMAPEMEMANFPPAPITPDPRGTPIQQGQGSNLVDAIADWFNREEESRNNPRHFYGLGPLKNAKDWKLFGTEAYANPATRLR